VEASFITVIEASSLAEWGILEKLPVSLADVARKFGLASRVEGGAAWYVSLKYEADIVLVHFNGTNVVRLNWSCGS